MRILAIRGRNLASLADPFDIDLDGDPLGTTGIFAITGETGAGKSTILDAMCLGLYGQYPRVSVNRREDVPDPSGQTMGAGDPRAILRRGAGEGFAEVDFLGRDGIGYRARWTANRARGRANGRLQAESRSLTRIGDGAGIATGKTAVNDAVVAITDLNFDQFRRTVVLAQNEFDAFLLASDGERGDLLEKITGTAVYTEISKRVRAGTDAHRAELAVLVARRDAVGLLDDGIRDGMLAERAAIDAAMPGLAAEHATHLAAVARAHGLVAAEAQVTAATLQVSEAVAAIEVTRDDAARLAELDATEPLRRMAEAVATAENALAAADTIRQTALADVALTDARHAEIRDRLAIAASADEAAEESVRIHIPIWTAADVLDARVKELTRETAEAAARATRAKAAFDHARSHRQELDRVHDEAVASRDATARRLATDAGMAALAHRGPEIAGLFEKRRTLTGEREAALATLAEAETRIAASDAATASASERAMMARRDRLGLVETRTALENELNGLDADATAASHARLRVALERLSLARDISRRHDASRAVRYRAHTMLSQAEVDRGTAEARRDTATNARGEAAGARLGIAAMVDLAEGAVSAEAANLRSVLVDGEPCPVCGSPDHAGGREGHATEALTRLAQAMRERRAKIDEDAARADADIAKAAADRAEACARLEAATRSIAEAQASLSELAETYARHRVDLAGSCISAGIPDGPPDELGPGASDRLQTVSATAATASDALFARLERVRALEGEIRARGKDIAGLETTIAAADGIVRLEAEPRQDAALTAERERTRAEDRAERVRSLARELAPVLAAAGLEPAALDADPDGTARRIAELGAAYADVRGRHRVLSDAVVDVLPRRAVAIEAEGNAVASEGEAARTARDLAAMLANVRSERAAVLGGEPTEAHRARITADRDMARANHGMAREAIGIAADLHAAARGSAEHADAQCRQADLALEGARERFRITCDARPIEGVLALLSVPQETRDALRDAHDRLRRAHEAALVSFATRQADLDALRALPPVDLAESEAAVERIAGTIATHQGRRGALYADLLRDDEARGRAANLSGEVEAGRETLACWDMVDAAVGSPTGDRFRRFAQGVTLEHLAQLANGQLRILSPRYALARSQGSDLALHVIDRDMDNELRGIRSLSGGERFLVSLALALALSGLEGRQAFVDTLFIDEGFGSLDADTLDVAIDALEALQGQGRRVGVITHVAAMIDRIAVQVRVERRGCGRSVVQVADRSLSA